MFLCFCSHLLIQLSFQTAIGAGILTTPFFEANRPFSMNYGAIGMVIAHEFTHGFDDQGRQFDERGNVKNWWTEQATKQFSNRSQCFVKQYGAIEEKVTKMHVSGHIIGSDLDIC